MYAGTRVMVMAAVLAIGGAGCKGDPGPQGPTGPEGPPGQQGPQGTPGTTTFGGLTDVPPALRPPFPDGASAAIISQIVVNASADCGSIAPAPRLEVYVDGQLIGGTDVTNSTYADTAPFLVDPPRYAHEVALAFTNDSANGGCDHNLHVNELKLTTAAGAIAVPATDGAHVIYDRGGYFDSQDVLPAGNDMNWTGALRFFLAPSATVPNQRFAIARNFADVRNTSTTYVNVAGRTLTYVKQSPATMLRVTYQDSFGTLMTGTHTTSCRWRLLVDGTQAGREQWNHSSTTTGWRIWSGNLQWVLPSVGEGARTFQVQVLRETGASECLNGWNSGFQENFLLVEEM